MKKTFLLDVNVLLAIVHSGHAHHRIALHWFDQVESESCFVCRLTQMGLLRLITNRAVMGENVLTLGAAWAVFEQLMSDERILFTSEPEGIEACWRQWTSGMTYAHRIWNDAFLASFAFTGEFEFVTLDHGFRAYPGLKLTIIAN